jgi:hypothetical protein
MIIKLITACLLFCTTCLAQQQEQKVLLYNIGFGGLSAGLGSIFNTPKGQNWKKSFIKGFWQGCIGGSLHYTGKKTVYLINKNQNLAAAWPAKLQHAAGSSIIENAALRKPFLKNWNFDLGPVRLDYAIDGGKLRARFLTVSIYACIAGFSHGQLDSKASVFTGTFVFENSNLISAHYAGISYGRAISYYNDFDKYHTIAHELIHVYQFSEYLNFNTWIYPLTNHVKSEKIKHVFENYIYMDVPYFVLFYALEGRHSDYYYYRNFYEFEAERFSTNAFVPVK